MQAVLVKTGQGISMTEVFTHSIRSGMDLGKLEAVQFVRFLPRNHGGVSRHWGSPFSGRARDQTQSLWIFAPLSF
jgi:hypothetical protein